MLRNIKNTAKTANKVIKQKKLLARSFKTQCEVKSTDILEVNISGEVLEFPHCWLRENCQCTDCFHYSAKSRIIDWRKFNIGVKPSSVSQTSEAVNIVWEDGHQSKFTVNWLKLRSFKPGHQKLYFESVYKPKRITWIGDEFGKICEKYEYNEIINSENSLHDWLENLSVYGVNIIKNTPTNDSALDDILKAIGFPKQTHYGVKFVIINVPNTSNVAYLSSNLPLHVDLPYYEYMPGVNILHCAVQTNSGGGESILTDALYTANFMKEHHSDEFKLLSELDVEWCDIGVENGNEFFKLHRAPVISIDRDGQISHIRFSIPQRGSVFPFDISLVKPWYEAHGLFLKLNLQFAAKFKIKEGDILAFDNRRLLHGRSEYVDSSQNVRKLISSYVDWDEIFSRLRVLKLKLGKVSGVENT